MKSPSTTPMKETRKDPALAAEQALLRRDAVTLLQYLRDHSVTGTQAAGNLPLQAIHEINTQLVPPMKLEERIGDKIYQVRSEDQVWRIYLPHILANVARLVTGGRARRLRLSRVGEKFLASDAMTQSLVLFSTWWNRINWLILYPYTGMGDALPFGFSFRVLQQLKRLPGDERISFPQFADEVIESTGLTWGSADPTYHRMALHGAIGRMVISVLEDFGAVKQYYRSERLGTGTFKRLSKFQITPFGHALLDSLSEGK